MVKLIYCEQAIDVVVASSFYQRLKGFLGEKPQKGDALLIVPCKQVHTFFMKTSLDILYLGKDGKVLAYYQKVPPGKILPYSHRTHMVLEMGVGTMPIIVGEKVSFVTNS